MFLRDIVVRHWENRKFPVREQALAVRASTKIKAGSSPVLGGACAVLRNKVDYVYAALINMCTSSRGFI